MAPRGVPWPSRGVPWPSRGVSWPLYEDHMLELSYYIYLGRTTQKLQTGVVIGGYDQPALSDRQYHHFYSARNARIASAVLATAIPSVSLSARPSVRPSVTRRYCVKTTARSTVQFAPLDNKMCLVL